MVREDLEMSEDFKFMKNENSYFQSKFGMFCLCSNLKYLICYKLHFLLKLAFMFLSYLTYFVSYFLLNCTV